MADGEIVRHRELSFLAKLRPEDIAPIRLPPAHKNHSHIPGRFWMSRTRTSHWYESRLEMAVLKRLDFELPLVGLVTQPCRLHFLIDKRWYSHVPDFLTWTSDGTRQLRNVRARRYLEKPAAVRAFGACQLACGQIGFGYQTHSEPTRVDFLNLNWLAGYRRTPPQRPALQAAVCTAAAAPISIRALVARIDEHPALVKPVVFHLLWLQRLQFDRTSLLQDSTLVQLNQTGERPRGK